jgi:2-iminoacetate synthase
MSFSKIIDHLEKSPLVRRFEELMNPKTDAELEQMAQTSRSLTLKHFGKAMRLFAPLYLSNECINSCKYCGFARENAILRLTLEIEEMLREARHLKDEGFRHILLVAGEHPKFVSNGYLEQCVKVLSSEVASVSLEVAPMETSDYEPMVKAGAEGVIVYQETYHRPTYGEMHTFGPKKDYDWRLDCPERAYAAGFRRIGIAPLFGLWEWREEAVSLAMHAEYLFKKCWKTYLTLSLPRLRPAAGNFHPRFHMSDREFVQLVCALRITFPQAGLVLSTREPGVLRDALIPLGITMMSAGSHTEPGGYTGQGRESLHQTVRGKKVDLGIKLPDASATEQFMIADERSAGDIAALLRWKGFEPVWKDWDRAILSP